MAHVIDNATQKLVANVLVDTRPREAKFTPDGKEVWVSSEVGGMQCAGSGTRSGFVLQNGEFIGRRFGRSAIRSKRNACAYEICRIAVPAHLVGD